MAWSESPIAAGGECTAGSSKQSSTKWNASAARLGRQWLDRVSVPAALKVGSDVAANFPLAMAETTWGTASVDLVTEVARRLGDVAFEVSGDCH